LVANINTGDVVLRGKQHKNVYKDEDFELSLAKKDLLFTHEEGKNPQVGSGIEPVSKKEGQGFKQIGETAAKPYLE